MDKSDKEEKPVASDNEEEENNDVKLNSASSNNRQIIVILDMAQLETVKTRKGDYQLLNCDDHIAIMRKHNKDPQLFRPDIVHQELMAVLDSPLNKAGFIKVVLIIITNACHIFLSIISIALCAYFEKCSFRS